MTDDQFFVVSANGYYSWDYDWDSGCVSINYVDELQPVECYRYGLKLKHQLSDDREAFYKIGYTDILECGHVILLERTSHEGSRNVKLIVLAGTKNSAWDYAWAWLNEHYPVKD